MRRAFVGACIISASVSVFLACSSDSTGATSTQDAGKTTTGTDDSGVVQQALGDGGVTPTGCSLIGTTAHVGKVAKSVVRDDKPDGIPWTNPEGALDEDGQFASVVLDDGQESAELNISDFGFEIPASYETWGMVVQLKRQVTTDGGVIQSSYVNVGIDGKSPGFKFDSASFYWPTKIVGTHDYGAPIDTWLVDLFPSDINAKTFSAKLWAKKAPVTAEGPNSVTGPVTATVEALRVIVWFCPK